MADGERFERSRRVSIGFGLASRPITALATVLESGSPRWDRAIDLVLMRDLLYH